MIRSVLTTVVVALIATGCGDRFTPAQLEELSVATSDVLIAVQKVADSTARVRAADSVARAHGFEGWQDLREEIGAVATEPDRLRAMLDSTQRRLEARAQAQPDTTR